MSLQNYRTQVLFFLLFSVFSTRLVAWELTREKDSLTDKESIFLRQVSVLSDKGEFFLGCVTRVDGSRSALASLATETFIPVPLETTLNVNSIRFQIRLGETIRTSSGLPILNRMGVSLIGEDIRRVWDQVLRGDGRLRIRLIGSSEASPFLEEVQTFDFNGVVDRVDAETIMRECPLLQLADQREIEEQEKRRQVLLQRRIAAEAEAKAKRLAEEAESKRRASERAEELNAWAAKEAAIIEANRLMRDRSNALGQYVPKSFVDDFYKNIVKPVSTDNRSLNRKARHIRDNAGYERGPDKAQNSVDMAVSFSLNADGTASDVRYVVTGRSTRLDEELDGFRIKPFFEALRTKPITSIPPPELVGRQFTAWISFCDLFRCKEYEMVAGARLFGIEKKGLHLVEFSGISNYWPLNDLPKNHHEYLFRPTELVTDAAF